MWAVRGAKKLTCGRMAYGAGSRFDVREHLLGDEAEAGTIRCFGSAGAGSKRIRAQTHQAGEV